MIIAIPSRGRPGRVKSHEIIQQAHLYVPENEVEAYERAGGRNVVAVPNEIRGITRTRNWILDHADDPWVVFLDDDVRLQGWCELRAHDSRKRLVRPDQWVAEFVRLFEITEQIGYRIWGVSTDGATRSVYPYRPFIWHTYVTASCMGIRNDTGVRFDESFPVKEDYELCLRCIKEDGGIVGARYLYWVNDHWKGEGGCKEYRTAAMEEEAIARLMRMYPGFIRRVERRGTAFTIQLDF